ncbi:MAG: GAF domain-containing protein [Anaerolineales bacterium]|nr:GAF domain-containing protein [Anaerolineales bacterium]
MNKLPISGILVAALAVSGLIPLLVYAITGSIIGGLVALIVAGGGAIVFLLQAVGQPIHQLSGSTQALETALSTDAPLDTSAFPQVGMVQEVTDLGKNLQSAMVTFQKRLTELNSMHAISQTITSSTLDYSKTVQSVLAAVQRVVDYDAAEVAVLQGNTLTVQAWWGKDGFKDTTGREYRIGKGPTGTIAATKEPLFLPVVQATEDLQRTIGYASVETEFISKSTKLVISSFLGIPLLIGERLIGTLTLVHHEAGYFTENNKRQLNKLAEIASIAIDNALQVRDREEALQSQIRELKIEIDRAKLATQVNEVVQTDYFQHLQANASKMRERYNKLNEETPAESDSEKS